MWAVVGPSERELEWAGEGEYREAHDSELMEDSRLGERKKQHTLPANKFPPFSGTLLPSQVIRTDTVNYFTVQFSRGNDKNW